ncbi:MAG: endonuclease/exonuclease/phosphatase family protein [bacterium]
MKLISVNVEKSRHLDRVIPFLKEQQADIICLQELCEQDVELFKRELKMEGEFIAMNAGEQAMQWGVGLLSHYPLSGFKSTLYDTFAADYMGEYAPHKKTMTRRPLCHLLSARIQQNGVTYSVATTHFTWAPDGKVTDEQRVNLKSLSVLLDGFPELILCGDFNAVRGTEIFDALATRYTDNIPAEATTTLDGNLHRAGPLPYVVDGMFTSKEYVATSVRVVDGVSDHCAIVAEIERVF